MRRCRRFARPIYVGALLCAVMAGEVRAQGTDGAAAEGQANTQSTALPSLLPPAYEEPMLRLAEILGSLHYLRELCKTGEEGEWRKQMEELLSVEDPTPDRRAKLIGRFNRGFRGPSEVYRECTPAAAEAANRYLRQGTRLAGEIPGRYGQ